jgi:hypothetical protein
VSTYQIIQFSANNQEREKMSKSNTKVRSASRKVSDEYRLRAVAPPAAAQSARLRITTYFKPMNEVVPKRLDEQYRRVIEVAGNIEAAKEAWNRGGLVCGEEVGKQNASLEAMKQMHSLLKLAAETLRDIAKRIDPEPPAIWQPETEVVEEVAHV